MFAMLILMGSLTSAMAQVQCSFTFPVWQVCSAVRSTDSREEFGHLHGPFHHHDVDGDGTAGTPGGTPGTPGGTPGTGKGDHNHDGHSDNGKGDKK